MKHTLVAVLVCAALAVIDLGKTAASERAAEFSTQAGAEESSPGLGDSLEEAQQRSFGCVSCHNPMDSPTMHTTGTVHLGCTDCHGGNAKIALPAGVSPARPERARQAKGAWTAAVRKVFLGGRRAPHAPGL